jgi:hypothetical protein
MRRTVAFAIIVAIAGLSFGSYAWARNANLKSEFYKTKRGETESAVVQRMGAPSSINSPCYNTDFWLDEHVSHSGCVRELAYNAVALPKYWSIGFDKNGRAVTKYENVSP